MVKGRFAPSPTGRMHAGNVFAALLSWLSARSQGGSWLLRHEDLDSSRCSREYAVQIEKDLKWLGLDWDEGGLESRGGVSGTSYLQSQRSSIYQEEFRRIEKLTYPCWCTRADLLSAGAPHESDGRVVYSGHCRQYLNASSIHDGPAAIRLLVADKEIEFTDRHYGLQSANLAIECGDFILKRKDGGWAYQFAVTVDDALMGISEVVRGRDLLLSSIQQIYLIELLGYKEPIYSHIPLLCNGNGQRLCKRDREKQLDCYDSAEELTGLLAFRAGLIDMAQPCCPEELISLFDWKKIPLNDIICR